MWEGGECWIIGGGPSMPQQFGVPEDVIDSIVRGDNPPSMYSPYMAAIHGKHVIAINVAFLIGDWIDMVFFGDNKFFVSYQKQLAEFPGLKVTCNSKFSSGTYDGENIKYVAKDKSHSHGISDNQRMVSWNGNSGAAAISIAANAGCERIILLGFDMKVGSDQRQHWHDLYRVVGRKPHKTKRGRIVNPNQVKHLPFARHLRGFPDIACDTEKRGITILNASPDSAIEQFKKVTVKEILHNGKV